MHHLVSSISKKRRTVLAISLGTALIVAVIGYVYMRSDAAALFASLEAEKGAVSGNAKIISDGNASGGQAVQFAPSTPPPAPTPTPPVPAPTSCALPAYPKPSCTGVPAGVNLTTVDGNVTLAAGQTLEGKRVTGSVTVTGAGVVIKNSEIYGTVNNWSGGTGARFTIQDSTVGAPTGCDGEFGVGARNYLAVRVHVRNHGDGFRVSGNDVTIKDSFIKLCSNPGDHSDGIQGNYAGINNIIDHNTIDQRLDHDTTSPIFWADESKQVSVTDNLLMGGGFTLRLHNGGGSTFTATGNRFVENSWDYGPVSSSCDLIKPWSDNRYVTIDSNYNVTALKGTVACG